LSLLFCWREDPGECDLHVFQVPRRPTVVTPSGGGTVRRKRQERNHPLPAVERSAQVRASGSSSFRRSREETAESWPRRWRTAARCRRGGRSLPGDKGNPLSWGERRAGFNRRHRQPSGDTAVITRRPGEFRQAYECGMASASAILLARLLLPRTSVTDSGIRLETQS